jgi:hypothetical protein
MIYVCDGINQLCHNQLPNSGQSWYLLNSTQCADMKTIEIDEDCIDLPQHNILSSNSGNGDCKAKGLSDRVCYSDCGNFKFDDGGCDPCTNVGSFNFSITPCS